jgi:glutamyl-tRNA synthetase
LPQVPATGGVVGRLAPSPTGELHLGHARSFLLAYWSARSQQGRLVLRLEDLDVERAQASFSDLAREDLAWLGIEWDQERLQSDGLTRIREAAFELLRAGHAYPCVCSRGDIQQALSAPHGPDGARYPGTCRDRFSSLESAERHAGKAAGLRFRSQDTLVRFRDAVCGEQAENVFETSGDFLILRRDKLPAYHLAVVFDDLFDGVTEVLRGDDLLSSTPRQIALHHALGKAPPAYVHVPLVQDAEGRRLAKRARDLSLLELRSAGTDPRAIVAWAAQSSGFAVPERVLAREVVPLFSLERLARAPVRVNGDTVAQFLSTAPRVAAGSETHS